MCAACFCFVVLCVFAACFSIWLRCDGLQYMCCPIGEDVFLFCYVSSICMCFYIPTKFRAHSGSCFKKNNVDLWLEIVNVSHVKGLCLLTQPTLYGLPIRSIYSHVAWPLHHIGPWLKILILSSSWDVRKTPVRVQCFYKLCVQYFRLKNNYEINFKTLA